jgi:hypothetical protein
MPDYPHEIVIDLGRTVVLEGPTYLPRQDMRNGWISQYAVYVGDSKERWGQPVARGKFEVNRSKKTVTFGRTVRGRYLRFVAEKGIESQRFASIAELDVILVEN